MNPFENGPVEFPGGSPIQRAKDDSFGTDDCLKAGMIAFGKARLNFPEGTLFNWLKMIR